MSEIENRGPELQAVRHLVWGQDIKETILTHIGGFHLRLVRSCGHAFASLRTIMYRESVWMGLLLHGACAHGARTFRSKSKLNKLLQDIHLPCLSMY